MKRLIFIALAVTLAMAMVWVPSVAAVGPYPIPITKTIPVGGPPETFTFQAYRDMNNNGILDFDDPVWGPDILVGTVDITGAGTGVINSPFMGNTIVHEVLAAGSAYKQQPDQIVSPPCGEVIFDNEVQVQEVGEIVILKEDPAGNALLGATFVITPDPKTGTGSLTVVDNGLNDELPLDDGILLVTGCTVCITCTVTETVPPPGYTVAPPQTAHVITAGETVVLTFVDTPEEGELIIKKVDGAGDPLAGATFVITPDPKTAAGSLTVVDNGLNDEDPAEGVLLVTGCIIGTVCTVEETVAPPGYELAPPQTVTISATVTLTFVDTPEKGELIIKKVDGAGDPLAGATFEITPNPKTATGSLTVVDNGLNDEDPAEGVLLVTGCIIGTVCTVEETVAPPGYELAAPQTVTISATVTLTFVNTPELSCGTVCAAQTAPGEDLFSDEQDNWFTWIYYDKGSGTESEPYEYPIYTGQTKLCGTLYVYDNGTHIFVNYVLTDMGACTLAGLSEYHLQVDKSFNDLKKAIVKKKNPIPGKCEYKGTLDPMQPATGWIEATEDDISGWTDPIYIFAHGVGCYYCP